MKKHHLLLIAIIFFHNQITSACGCTTDGSFLEVSIGAELIAVIEVQEYLTYDEVMGEDVPMSMSVKIKKVLKGAEPESEIVIWGNNGLMCSPYLSLFDIGTTWVVVLKASPMEGHKNAKIEDYGISNCGEHFLNVKNGVVSGLINTRDSYQSMSISTLKKNLDIINREEDRVDRDKCLFIQELRQLGVDTIGVFENYPINNTIRTLKVKTTFQMSIDDAFPAFYEYMKSAVINRQVFVYWNFRGTTYVKQIDNLFQYDAVVATESSFFDIFMDYNEWLIPERLKLPIVSKKKIVVQPNKYANKKVLNKKVNLVIPHQTPAKATYSLQSFQVFIDGSIFLRDFDTRLFEADYNPTFYKKNRKTLTYDWLKNIAGETNDIAMNNENWSHLFEYYKRSIAIR